MTTKKPVIHPAQRRLIQALARRDVACYLRAQSASRNAIRGDRQNHVRLQREHRAA